MGRESRKLRRPFAVAENTASPNFCNSPVRIQHESSILTKNTNVKGQTRFILRNISKNVTSESKPISSWSRTMTSSENTGDVIVENTSVTIA